MQVEYIVKPMSLVSLKFSGILDDSHHALLRSEDIGSLPGLEGVNSAGQYEEHVERQRDEKVGGVGLAGQNSLHTSWVFHCCPWRVDHQPYQ